jgi:hypothetical protein
MMMIRPYLYHPSPLVDMWLPLLSMHCRNLSSNRHQTRSSTAAAPTSQSTHLNYSRASPSRVAPNRALCRQIPDRAAALVSFGAASSPRVVAVSGILPVQRMPGSSAAAPVDGADDG